MITHARSHRLSVALAMPLLCALVACGSSSNGNGNGNGTPGGGSGLTGVWVGTGSRAGGAATMVTVTIGASLFSVQSPGGMFLAQRQGAGFAITYAQATSSAQAVAQQTTPGSLGFGDMPIDVSGDWKITAPVDDGTNGCSTTLALGSASATCAEVSGLPHFLPFVANGSASATRSQTLASSFGDLGGVWNGTLSGGGTCTVTFEGDTFASTCFDASRFTGTMQVTINGSVASGQTSEGYEFSAQRQ